MRISFPDLGPAGSSWRGLLTGHSGDSNLSLFLMEAWSQSLMEGRFPGSIQTLFGSAWPRLAALAARMLSV